MKKALLIAALFLFFTPLAHAQCDLTATPATITAQQAAAQAGQTLCLSAGNYPGNNGKANVLITAVPGATVNVAGAAAVVPNAKFSFFNWTAPVCVIDSPNVLIDHTTFINLGQSCNEGRLGLKGNVAGTVISNNTFDRGVSDGIQLTNQANGVHIGPGNVFSNIVQEQCGSVHCDAIQFYWAHDNTVEGNYFVNDSTIIMSPDCNGTPLTFTNNVVDQQHTSLAAALTIGKPQNDLYTHNTMIHGGFRIYAGNTPGGSNACTGSSGNATVKDNLDNFTGVIFVGGPNPTTWAGFLLAPGSAGIGQASDGLNLGINSGTPPPPTPIMITTTSLPNGTVGLAYSAQLTSSGGQGVPVWTGTVAAQGLALSSTGLISGTPTMAAASTVSATVTAGTTASANIPLTIQAAPPPNTCKVGNTSWTNSSFASQTGQFTADFDVTPSQSNMDGVVMLSKGSATSYANGAVIVRFNPSGTIDARNGANYAAMTSVPYAAGQAWHFRIPVNLTTHTYSVWVKSGSAAEIQIANNYAFRSEQSGLTSLNNWVAHTENNTETVCNFAISTAPPPVMISINPTSTIIQTDQTQQFTATVTGSANTAVNWSVSTCGSINATGLFTAPSAPCAGVVTATSLADPTKTAPANVTVNSPPPSLTPNGCSKTGSTFSCVFGYANMPPGTVATVTGSADGQSVQQTITIP